MYPNVVETGLRPEQDDPRTLRQRIAALPPPDVKHLTGFTAPAEYRPDQVVAATRDAVVKALTENPVPVTHDGVTVGHVDPGSVVVQDDGSVLGGVVVTGGAVGNLLGLKPGQFPTSVVTITPTDDGPDCDTPDIVVGR